MRVFLHLAAVVLAVGAIAGCSTRHDYDRDRDRDRDMTHDPYRGDDGGPAITRGGRRDDWTRSQFDPVCGMRVDPHTGYTESYNGHTYYFDTRDCASRFHENPQAYFPSNNPRDVR